MRLLLYCFSQTSLKSQEQGLECKTLKYNLLKVGITSLAREQFKVILWIILELRERILVRSAQSQER